MARNDSEVRLILHDDGRIEVASSDPEKALETILRLQTRQRTAKSSETTSTHSSSPTSPPRQASEERVRALLTVKGEIPLSKAIQAYLGRTVMARDPEYRPARRAAKNIIGEWARENGVAVIERSSDSDKRERVFVLGVGG